MRLEKKVAIITGGANGIGRAYSIGFAKEGARVVIADTDEKKALETIDEILRLKGEAVFVYTDISNKSSANNLVNRTMEKFGRLDILVNNAAILVSETVMDITEENWDKQFAVNAKGTVFCSQSVIPVMVKQGNGKIINVSSIGALAAQPGLCAYHSTKAAVLAITRSFALEMINSNIQVNAVVPGTTVSGMAERAMKDPAFKKRVVDTIPIGRLGKPEELLGAVLYFASEDSNYCTGQTLIVDGGVMMAC